MKADLGALRPAVATALVWHSRFGDMLIETCIDGSVWINGEPVADTLPQEQAKTSAHVAAPISEARCLQPQLAPQPSSGQHERSTHDSCDALRLRDSAA